MLSQVVELIENKQDFAITTHLKPDGDGVGSSLGLCWLLRSLGKSAEVVVRGDIPLAYRSLPGADEIRDIARIDRDYDAIFVIECSDLERPGIAGLGEQFTVNIDHHATSEHFGTVNWIDSTASAVGEMIFHRVDLIQPRKHFFCKKVFTLLFDHSLLLVEIFRSENFVRFRFANKELPSLNRLFCFCSYHMENRFEYRVLRFEITVFLVLC